MITIVNRPYVFIFLIAFMVIAGQHLGWRRMLLWLVTGYLIALVSEASSIRNGFPYGLYHYVYENLRGEWMLFGVPVWDSLSYPFMIYAGYAMALMSGSPPLCKGRAGWGRGVDLPPPTPPYKGGGLCTALLGAFFTTLLDIIIDPLTVRGDQWFLGNIYYYPHGGQYFGVPLTNFLGWFFVPLVVIFVNQWFWKLRPTPHVLRPTSLGALFYLSIALFNVAITFWIGAWPLALASLGWLLLGLFLLPRLLRLFQK